MKEPRPRRPQSPWVTPHARSRGAAICISAMPATREDDEAKRHRLELVAAQGDDDAQCALGLMHRNGEGGLADFAAARRLLGLAAAQGHAAAQWNLGIMHSQGEGGPEDVAEARRLYGLAAAQGDASAQSTPSILQARPWHLKASRTASTFGTASVACPRSSRTACTCCASGQMPRATTTPRGGGARGRGARRRRCSFRPPWIRRSRRSSPRCSNNGYCKDYIRRVFGSVRSPPPPLRRVVRRVPAPRARRVAVHTHAEPIHVVQL